jgi:hypothetical protein
MRGVKHLVVGALLVVLALSAFVRAEACWVEEWKRDQPVIINSMLAAFLSLTCRRRFKLDTSFSTPPV